MRCVFINIVFCPCYLFLLWNVVLKCLALCLTNIIAACFLHLYMLASPAHLYMPHLFTHCLPTIIWVMLMSIVFSYFLFLLYATFLCDSILILACLCTYFLFRFVCHIIFPSAGMVTFMEQQMPFNVNVKHLSEKNGSIRGNKISHNFCCFLCGNTIIINSRKVVKEVLLKIVFSCLIRSRQTNASLIYITLAYFKSALRSHILKPKMFSTKTQNPRNVLKTHIKA